MTYEAQDNALRARFEAQWDHANYPIAWPNVEFTPPASTAWVRFAPADAGAEIASFGDPGNNVYRHSGLLTVMIFSPLNQGDGPALALADTAAAIFRGWTDAAVGLRVRQAPFIRRIGAEKSWYHVNVLIPFERDSHF